jgi:hypothetical protein
LKGEFGLGGFVHVKDTDHEEKALIELGTEGQSLTEREREVSEGGDRNFVRKGDRQRLVQV